MSRFYYLVSKLESLIRRLRRLGWPGLCSALMVCLGLLGALLYWQHSQRNQQAQLSDSGQALAMSAAHQAVGATLNQDMISLQVVLRELNRHPSVIGATIHDVEGRLLVQSGSVPDNSGERELLSYSSTIALDDNIAGHLRLLMSEPGMTPADVRFFWLWSFVVLVAAGSPWLARWRKPETGRTAKSEPAPESPPADPCALRLSLNLLNLPRLFRQLNHSHFNQLVRQLEHQLHGILTLYGGRSRWVTGQVIQVDFEGSDTHDCAFRALCSARLLTQLLTCNSGPKLQLKAHIGQVPEPGELRLSEALIAQQEDESEPGVFIDPALLTDDLHRHLALSPDTGRLSDIKPPYKALLEKQQHQLLGSGT